MKVVVIGSSNIDMVAQVSHLPAPGETVGDANFMQSLGGKGANQAVAAARLGGFVTFVTSLGNDMYADILKNHFKKEGITTDYIIDDVNHPTGTALIFVADSGENCIAVAPGANYSLLPGSITHFSKVIDEADIIVMQAEIPYETIKKIALSAKKKGKKVLFNPAPACLIDEELMKAIDILVVNELEASFISGIDYTDNNLEEIAETLLKAGTSNVVITLGSQGAYMKNAKETIQLPGCKVNAIDTIAAGDTFCGALAVVCAKKEIDRELTQRIVRKVVNSESKAVTVDEIINTVCKHFGLETATIHTKSRKREVVQARQIAMYLAKNHTDFSTAKIGALIGHKDHATVLHACKTIKELKEVDKSFRAEIDEIQAALKKG